ncbi:MAG: FAD-binding oxidoreductase [Bacteroidetes bacterium]|nr:MAG: FAD-binding oxidoreductase [Bacteroidota bacterium]
MQYSPVTEELINEFKGIIGNEYVISDDEGKEDYSHDETLDFKYSPEVVLKPRTPEEISKIIKICNEKSVPVTPCAARTGLSGGALPLFGGVSLSVERFNEILQIDERNLQATVEPGVINQVFQDAVIEKGLFYPPDPASKGSCFLGGNLAESSGGPKAVKYGVTKDYVLNLEVVLPTGEIIWTGANTLKNATGYNITQLMVGSEGTLGIITKAVFRLIPYPKENLLLLAPFKSADSACEAVSTVFRKGYVPSALEFMEREAIQWSVDYNKDISFDIEDDTKAYLLVEVDGNELDVLLKECEQICEVLYEHGCGEIMFADTSKQKEDIWNIRRRIGEAVRSVSIYQDEDTVVPRAELPKLLKGVKEICSAQGLKCVCYGHAGDGNLHVNIVKGDLEGDEWKEKLNSAATKIFKLCVELGGTISGEHGIGLLQKEYMNIPFDKVQINLMKGIKNVFDPNGIMNPGKIFPDTD